MQSLSSTVRIADSSPYTKHTYFIESRPRRSLLKVRSFRVARRSSRLIEKKRPPDRLKEHVDIAFGQQVVRPPRIVAPRSRTSARRISDRLNFAESDPLLAPAPGQRTQGQPW